MFAFVELAHFELKCVGTGVASSCEVGRSGIGFLQNVASDG